jgi:hypothetical protein
MAWSVHGALSDASGSGDVVHRRPSDAAFGDQAPRRVEHAHATCGEYPAPVHDEARPGRVRSDAGGRRSDRHEMLDA